MNSDNKKLLNIINQTLENTDYILEKHSYDHIYEALKKWLNVFTLFSLFHFTLPCIAPYLGWYDTYAEIYFPFFRLGLILLSMASVFTFYREIKKPFLDVRQKDFLMFFLVFIAMLSICQILGPLTFFFNHDMLLHLTKTLPLALLITPLGILLLIYFTKNYKLIGPMILSLVLTMFYFSWNSYFHTYYEGDLFFGKIDDITVNFTQSGLPTVLCFIFVLLLLKKDIKH